MDPAQNQPVSNPQPPPQTVYPPPPPPPQQPPPNPPVPTDAINASSNPKSFNKTPLLIAVLVILVLILSGVFVYSNFLMNKQPQILESSPSPEQKIVVKATPAPTPDTLERMDQDLNKIDQDLKNAEDGLKDTQTDLN